MKTGRTSKLLALGCAALTALMVTAVLSPADARRGGGGGGGGGGSYRHHGGGGGGYQGPRYHSGRSYRYYGGLPYYGGVGIYIGPDYYYGAGCYYLRRQALRTGSPYWWNRYYACIGD